MAIFVLGCQKCGVLFVDPMPSSEMLDSLYAREGMWSTTHDAPLLEQERTSSRAARYLRYLFAPVSDIVDVSSPPAGATVVDVGCGAGELLDAFKAFGWDTCGLDPADRRAFARHRELSSIPTGGLMRVVVLHHVLEHVNTPLDILRAAADALTDDGIVVISVPWLDGLPLHRDFHYCISPRPHILAYTADCLRTLLIQAGFEPIDVSPTAHPGRRSPRRLQMLGIKRAPSRMAPHRPIEAARRALHDYRAADSSRLVGLLSLRMRAALLHVQRELR